MNIYEKKDLAQILQGNSYAGRGIVVGKTEDGKKACVVYFIMGRSENSRNRIFEEEDGVLYTKPFDESKVEDPSLIIYAALREFENNLIVTNGDQTDTIYEGIKKGLPFCKSLKERTFEPDAPNFTPRISAMLTFENGDFNYKMNILKSIDAEGSDCMRINYTYPSKPGLGHFLHTYCCDGDPLPTFQGEPERVKIGNNIDDFTREIWNSLNQDNKISLFVRYIDLASGKTETRIVNKHQ